MTFRILSVDGGGIRGIVSAQILKYLEEKVGRPLHEYFDLISGTSTGSIVAAGLGVGKSSSELIELYQAKGRTIFPYKKRFTLQRLPLVFRYGLSAPKFSPDGLISVLSEQFKDENQQDTLLQDVKLPILIAAYDTIRRKAIIFKGARKGKWYSKVPIWEACVCSAAAPTFFPAHDLCLPDIEGQVPKVYPNNEGIYLDCPQINSNDELNNMKIEITGGKGAGQTCFIKRYFGRTQEALVMKDYNSYTPYEWDTPPDTTSTYRISHTYAAVDGGVAANNPEGCAIAEGIKSKTQDSSLVEAIGEITLLSVGTGNLLESIPFSQVGQWGLTEWAPHIIDIVMNAPSDIYYIITKEILSGEKNSARRNLRLQPRLTKELSAIDDASQGNLDALIEQTDLYMKSKSIQKRQYFHLVV